jgi:uncharacterized protein
MLSPIRHEQNKNTGIFYMTEKCERKAYLAYTEQPEKVLQLTHTFVSDDLRGQGIAGRLAKHVMEYVLANNLKVVPICPYIIKWLENKAEYKDLVVEV